MSNNPWIFVDDLPDEAISFSNNLKRGKSIDIEFMSPRDARNKLLVELCEPSGVLMDVDLSSAAGEKGSGPGIAQDIRVKQKRGEAPEYPIVRFSRLDKVNLNIKGDPTSDDLFDLKRQKEEVVEDAESFLSELLGVQSIYADFKSIGNWEALTVDQVFGLSSESFAAWGDSLLWRKIFSSSGSVHVAAGWLLRTFILPTGLLIDEENLALRLGIDLEKSGEAWRDLIPKLSAFKYEGLGADFFPRWWSRGLDEWWFQNINTEAPLIATEARKRVERLSDKFLLDGIECVRMPPGSPGSCPWVFCELSLLSEGSSRKVPVDPSQGVRFYNDNNYPNWVDTAYVSLKVALQNKHDKRLDEENLERLRKKHV
ncbi:hypothetical protein ACGK9R_02965 [Halomonas sp. HNIBRBA4712]|uniref:hypothetical protein n=1 Tax=Halomonas sp. HNIBRBA4712 TaxID=3373087 RepID=UPI00374586EE